MAISLIAALDENFAIGRNGQLPWHLPDDLRWFKRLTIGKRVLMGYNTALSIGRVLPGRPNLVLSRRHDAPYIGQQTVRSLQEAIGDDESEELMVIGGAMVFAEALPLHRHRRRRHLLPRRALQRVDRAVAPAPPGRRQACLCLRHGRVPAQELKESRIARGRVMGRL